MILPALSRVRREVARRNWVILVPPWVVRVSGVAPTLPARMTRFCISRFLFLLRRGFVPSTEHRQRRPGRPLHRSAKRVGEPRSKGWCGQPCNGNSARMIAGWRGWTAGLGRSGKRGDEPPRARKRQGSEEQDTLSLSSSGIATTPDALPGAVSIAE